MKTFALSIIGAVVTVALIGFIMWLIPTYRVWQKNLSGQAQLEEASWNRQIMVEEAKAKVNSAKHLAEAEIVRAGGAAKANAIIGESLKENEAYLRYLWVQGLQDGSSEVIYVPTEANLPILEAGARVYRKRE